MKFLATLKPPIRFAFSRSFFQLKKVSEMELQLQKKESDFEKELQKKESSIELLKQQHESEVKLQKIELEHMKSLKDMTIIHLQKDLQNASLEVIKISSSYSVRAAVESIVAISQPGVMGASKQIQLEFSSNPVLQSEFQNLCVKFNCLNYSLKVPDNLYHSLSTHVHGGGLPIRCHLSDKTLSVAEWAFVIALFKIKLPPQSFEVYDNDNIEITSQI
jgi:hypothetical protein